MDGIVVATAKAAVGMRRRSLVLELGEHRIRMCAAPGLALLSGVARSRWTPAVAGLVSPFVSEQARSLLCAGRLPDTGTAQQVVVQPAW